MTFLVLDIIPPVGVASCGDSVYGSDPKILQKYIIYCIYNIYKQIQVPLWCFCIWLPRSAHQPSNL